MIMSSCTRQALVYLFLSNRSSTGSATLVMGRRLMVVVVLLQLLGGSGVRAGAGGGIGTGIRA